MNRHIALLAILVPLPSSCWAQEPAFNGVQPAAEGGHPYTEVLTPPIPVSGVWMPLTLAGESAQHNFVTGGVGLSAAYDDNIQVSPDHHLSDVSYLFSPSLEID